MANLVLYSINKILVQKNSDYYICDEQEIWCLSSNVKGVQEIWKGHSFVQSNNVIMY